jgi:antibiotic biosynthesis monooxygenase (ABM) superfamily enzyme
MQEGSKVQTMCTTILNTYNVKPSNPNFNKVWIFYQHKKKKQM